MGLGRYLKPGWAAERLEREVGLQTELEAHSDLYDVQVGAFWDNLASLAGASNPRLLEQVWVANRCLHMNANAISTMPLRHYGPREPAWVANPDPNWYPNGISDAVYSIVSSLYGWGDAFLLVSSRYADGYPSGWTVLDPAAVTVELRNGRRSYRTSQRMLDADDVVQISRNPNGGLRGTSAIASYSAYTNGLLATSQLSRVMMGSTAPQAVLKSKLRIDATQAQALQTAWMNATAARRGAPPVLGPDVEFERLAFSPAEMLLLDVQTYNAQVLATAFGIPASLINMPIEGGLNYQTPILLLEQWWRTELRTTCTRISTALSSVMLARGSYCEFDPYKFLAPSWKELVEGWVALVEAGLATPEEFRTVVLGLPPQEAADALALLSTPPSAGASPAQPASVVALRPTSSGTI